MQLLFGIPLIGGALITALDAFLLLLLMSKGFRYLEAFVIALLIVIATCFAIQIVAAAPPVAAILQGFIPSPEIVTNHEMLYIAMGIIGATVMPHNLYLHSSIVQILEQTGFDPKLLELEITESVLMQNVETTVQQEKEAHAQQHADQSTAGVEHQADGDQ